MGIKNFFLEEVKKQPKKKKEIKKEQYSTIGGWLVFFVIILIFLSPLFILVQYSISEELTLWGFSLDIGLAIYGIIVGINLWRLKPYSVKKAKEFLLIRTGVFIIIALLILYTYGDFYYMFFDTYTFQALVFFAIWYSYLNFTKRVKNTYNPKECNPNWKIVSLVLFILAVIIILFSTFS